MAILFFLIATGVSLFLSPASFESFQQEKSDRKKVEFIKSLRSQLPSRKGVKIRVRDFDDNGRFRGWLQVERSADGNAWRTLNQFSFKGSQHSALSVEAILGEQIIQTNLLGSFRDKTNFKQFTKDPKLHHSGLVLLPGTPSENGGMFFRELVVAFGFVLDGGTLIDLHSSSFVDACTLQKRENGNVVLTYKSGIASFEFDSQDKRLMKIQYREYVYGENQTRKDPFLVTLKPDQKSLLPNGLIEFAVSSGRSTDKERILKLDIEALKNNADLASFTHCEIRQGEPVNRLGKSSSGDKPLYFSRGKAVYGVDTNAEKQIQQTLQAESEKRGTTNKTPPRPKTRGNTSRFPYLRSSSSVDCGLYSLAIVAAKLGIGISLDDLLSNERYVSGDGSSVRQLEAALAENGFHPLSIRFANLDHLALIGKPAIVHCGNSYQIEGVSHWAAVLEIDRENRRVLWADLPHEPIWISESELMSTWDGTAVIVSREKISQTRQIWIRWFPLAGIIGLFCSYLLILFVAKKLVFPRFFEIGSVANGFWAGGMIVALSLVSSAIWLFASPLSYWSRNNSDAIALIKGKTITDDVDIDLDISSRWQDWETDADVLVLDARMPRDYHNSRVVNSLNLPPDGSLLELKIAWEKARLSKQCVVYCQTSRCKYSDRVAKQIKLMGHKNVIVFRPGFVGIPEGALQ